MEGATETEKTSNRKIIGVGLIIALLFLGGGIYAWQGSILKDSIGGIVNSFGLIESGQSERTGKDISDLEERKQPVLEKKPSVVRPLNSQVVRTSEPSVRILSPNGGEVFCVGDTIRIHWKYRGVSSVQVFLESDQERYSLGVMAADENGVSQRDLVLSLAGNTYRILIEANGVADISDDVFAIKDCTE